MSMPCLPFSPACERNRDPILQALRVWLPQASPARPLRVLELGSGTGEHAVHMARHLPGVHWQPSDLAGSLAGLRLRIELEGQSGLAAGARIEPPLCLDVTNASDWPSGPFEAVFSANTAHIMPATAVPMLLSGAAAALARGGLLLLYGPFHYGGVPTAASNAAFDARLQRLDPSMGVRDAEEIAQQAAVLGLESVADLSMPANNRLLVFRLPPTPTGRSMPEP